MSLTGKQTRDVLTFPGADLSRCRLAGGGLNGNHSSSNSSNSSKDDDNDEDDYERSV